MSDNRRQSFRIDNPVVIVYEVVSRREMQRNAASIREGGFLPGGVSAALLGMEAELKGRLARIKPRSAEIAQTLGLLNDKLNALINLLPLMNSEEKNIFEQPVRKTNVSATGLAFLNEEDLEQDAYLHLKLLLAPDYFYVAAYGRVVRCEPLRRPRDGFNYRVAVEFTLISDQHRELLVKYTMSRELALLRARRLAADAEEAHAFDAEHG